MNQVTFATNGPTSSKIQGSSVFLPAPRQLNQEKSMFKSLVDFFSAIPGSEEDDEEISPVAFKQKVDDPKFRCYLLPGEKKGPG